MSIDVLLAYAISFGILIFSIILHEVAHGYVAYRFGDWTAKLDGRLTLNPIPHIDPVGTIALPILFKLLGSPVAFGWAKPVPVNYHNLRGGERDYFWVSIAGIIVNLILAVIGGVVFRLLQLAAFPGVEWVAFAAYSLVTYNILLALFNLLPIPPLDGSRLIRPLLSRSQQMFLEQIEPYGFMILLVFLWFFQGRLAETVTIFSHWLTGA